MVMKIRLLNFMIGDLAELRARIQSFINVKHLVDISDHRTLTAMSPVGMP
jgi:hypothetical protein